VLLDEGDPAQLDSLVAIPEADGGEVSPEAVAEAMDKVLGPPTISLAQAAQQKVHLSQVCVGLASDGASNILVIIVIIYSFAFSLLSC